MLEQINNLRERGQNELNALTGTDQLPEWYHRYLGRKGDLTSLLKKLKTLPAEERPETGKVINKVKQELQELFESRQQNLRASKLDQQLEIKLIAFYFWSLINLESHFPEYLVYAPQCLCCQVQMSGCAWTSRE